MKRNLYGLLVGLKLSQKMVEPVVQKVNKQEVVTDSLRQASNARKGRRREDQERVKRDVKKQRKNEIGVQEHFYWFARIFV